MKTYGEGICEMLMQSHTGEIVLLPAMPKEWPNGSVKGLRDRRGFEIDITWLDGSLSEAVIHSLNRVRYGDETKEVKLEQGKTFTCTEK